MVQGTQGPRPAPIDPLASFGAPCGVLYLPFVSLSRTTGALQHPDGWVVGWRAAKLERQMSSWR
jgi:hypothetical protein